MACYCLSHNKDAPSEPESEPSGSSMDLDAALQELGMLSQITGSRSEYLKEKLGTKKKIRSSNSLSSSTAPLCVVQMNSDFITQFSLSSKNFQSRSDSEEERSPETEPVSKIKVPEKWWVPSARYLKRMARDKPYDKIARKRKKPVYIPVVDDRASPPAVARQDSGGNKSNPSSPAKSHDSHPPPVGSLVRSRSLDDLEIAKVEESKEDCYCRYARADIETVSQRISNLHVS